MYVIQPKKAHNPVIREFKRREMLPMIQNILWKVDAGIVRTFTLNEDGMKITLGIWGEGDIVGHPLSSVSPYQVECLCDAKMHRIQVNSHLLLDPWVWSNLQQSQILLQMSQGPVKERIKQFISWLSERFGDSMQDFEVFPHQLTHQDIAETIGATRVTVTRLIGELEKEGVIYWSRQQCLLYRNRL